jgi:hypothetical protein
VTPLAAITRTILLSHFRHQWLLNLERAQSARWKAPSNIVRTAEFLGIQFPIDKRPQLWL